MSTDSPALRSNAGVAATAHGDLPARWWQWSEAADPAHDPIDDLTGADCKLNQPKDIWFLAGTHGGAARRSCRLPAGHPIYFPVINQVCQVTSTESVADAEALCSGTADVATATLDGKPLPVNEALSEGSFELVSRPGSTTMPAGKHRVVAWGLWVGPIRLSRGEHKVTLTGRSGSFETEVTYDLTSG